MIPGTHTITESQQRPIWLWALGIGLPLLGALSFVLWGFAIAAWGPLIGVVPAVTCLVAGWLLRSWVGLVVTSLVLVYVGAGAVMWILAGGAGLDIAYVLAIVLPGVAMATIGTAIGMYRSR